MWNRIRKAFPFAERIENKLRPGVSDVHYSLHPLTDVQTNRHMIGWLELKYASHFPKNGSIEIPHYTPQQALWLGDLWKRGVMSHLVFGIGDNVYLFRGGNPIVTAGPSLWNRETFEGLADAVVPLRDGKEVVRALVGEHAMADDPTFPAFWAYREYF